MADHRLKTSQAAMEKLALSNNILTFMGKKGSIVLTLIVRDKLKKLLYQAGQVFFAQNVRNNKVDPNNTGIYTF